MQTNLDLFNVIPFCSCMDKAIFKLSQAICQFEQVNVLIFLEPGSFLWMKENVNSAGKREGRKDLVGMQLQVSVKTFFLY